MSTTKAAAKTDYVKSNLLPPLLAWPWLWLALFLLMGGSIAAWQQEPRPVPANHTTLPFSFVKPNETNPHRRLFSSYEDFRSISFAEDGLHGWIAGGKDVILATTDGGKNWKIQNADVPQDKTYTGLMSIYAHADGKRAWVTGDNGFIASTIDSGEHWTTQAINTNEQLLGVSFSPDGLHGWVVGNGATVIRMTNDGGKKWVAPQNINIERRLRALKMHPDGEHGWATGFSGSVATTADGGKTWRDVSVITKSYFSSLAVSESPRCVWVAGENGSIFFSKDDGKTWEQQNSKLTTEIAAITFQANGANGWASSYKGEMIATTDGGKTWVQQISNISTALTSIHFKRDGLTGWAVGKQGVVIHTEDGGQSWHPLSATSQPDLNAVSFHQNGLNGWAVGNNGQILTTADGGRNWRSQISGTRDNLLAITFNSNGMNGWAVGENGTIAATINGGEKWTLQTSGVKTTLSSAGFDQNGLTGWAADEKGELIATTNGGKNWDAKADWDPQHKISHSIQFSKDGEKAWGISESFPGGGGTLNSIPKRGANWDNVPNAQGIDFFSIHFNDDGQHVWAINGSGVSTDGKPVLSIPANGIVASQDGGRTWVKQHVNAPTALLAIHVNDDKLHGWAVGKGGLILTTRDGGKTWNYAEHYRRSPAPWYWLIVAASAFSLWLSWHFRPKGNAPDSVADVAASDAEIRLPTDDKLDFSGLSRGISRFLRNTETQPPLTMAITGDWGSGKSSLMQLVCSDLRKFGHRPIWFNAWHHQKAENLFAGLLGAIYAQAAPDLFSFSGILFRLNLLWCRSKRHFGAMMLAIIIVTSLSILSWNAFHHGGMQNVLATFSVYQKLFSQPETSVAAPLTAFFAGFTALFTAFYTLAKGTTIFGVNPASLLTKVGESMSLKTATAQNDFRDQFARQFKELTLALPSRLVIVIDDLDRCRPEAILEVMEAVNYLTSSGSCFVIFGMAKERVQAALGLAFKDIAAEMLAMDESNSTEYTNTKEDATLIKRRAYAADYLQKLVNIEIKVPGTRDKAVHRLLVANENPPKRRMKEFLRMASHMWPLAAAVFAVFVGQGLAESSVIRSFSEEPPPVVAKADKPVPADIMNEGSAPTKTQTPASVPASNTAPVKAEPEIIRDKPIYPGESMSQTSILVWLGLALIPIFFVGAIVIIRLLRKTILETKDSKNFRDALEIWTNVIASKRGTPRAIKRFGNRLRYLAMLQQGEARDETFFDVFKESIHTLLRRQTSSKKEIPPENALSEHQLIAIGAIYEVFGEKWKDELIGELSFNNGFSNTSDNERNLSEKNIENAVRMHQNKFDVFWPPTHEEIQVFERLIAGIRLAGDPQIITQPFPSEKYESTSSSYPSGMSKKYKT